MHVEFFKKVYVALPLSSKWSNNVMCLLPISYVCTNRILLLMCCVGTIRVMFHDSTVQEEIVPSPIQHLPHLTD